jgi:uncharacterized membrane protein YccC
MVIMVLTVILAVAVVAGFAVPRRRYTACFATLVVLFGSNSISWN